MAYPQRTLEVFEIFEEFDKAKTRADRLSVLKKYGHVDAFKDILRGTFDGTLEFLLPAGTPPFTLNNEQSVPASLLKKHKQFGYFVKGAKANDIPAFKREQKYIHMLESIHPKDVPLVLGMVSKKLPVKSLTKKLVMEALPDLIRD